MNEDKYIHADISTRMNKMWIFEYLITIVASFIK